MIHNDDTFLSSWSWWHSCASRRRSRSKRSILQAWNIFHINLPHVWNSFLLLIFLRELTYSLQISLMSVVLLVLSSAQNEYHSWSPLNHANFCQFLERDLLYSCYTVIFLHLMPELIPPFLVFSLFSFLSATLTPGIYPPKSLSQKELEAALKATSVVLKNFCHFFFLPRCSVSFSFTNSFCWSNEWQI